jgi:hypothetical protein
MNRTFLATVALSLALPLTAMAQSTTQTASIPASLSGDELHGLIKNAHSSEQYKQLAAYYHQQEAKYRNMAADEKAERDRRAQVNAALMQKYPRPVDSAQYLYESYVTDADRAAIEARHYDQLAGGIGTEHDNQVASSPQGKL